MISCTDCHTDYHNRQFVKNGIAPDCSQCHNVKGFTLFTFTAEQHNTGAFLSRVHIWQFHAMNATKNRKNGVSGEIGIDCRDCHADIHKSFIQPKYYPDGECKICHTENRWAAINIRSFQDRIQPDGSPSEAGMQGHVILSKNQGERISQKFSGFLKNAAHVIPTTITISLRKAGVTKCNDCHETENWKASRFDHNKTAFKLDGKHINVACEKCHKKQQEGSCFLC